MPFLYILYLLSKNVRILTFYVRHPTSPVMERGGLELDDLSLSEIYENTVQSYGKVLSSHEEILASKVRISLWVVT